MDRNAKARELVTHIAKRRWVGGDEVVGLPVAAMSLDA
jgi:hypothetical protein